MTRSDARTQQQRVEESTRRLATAAIELIAERGYSNTTAKDICLRAGYSRVMVAERFGNKEALLDYILSQYYERRLMVDAAPGATGLQRVLAPIDALRRFAVEDPQTLRAMFVLNFEAVHSANALRERITAWLDRLRSEIEQSVRAGRRDGSIRPGMKPRDVGADVLAAGIGHAYAWIVMPSAGDFNATLLRFRGEVARSLRL